MIRAGDTPGECSIPKEDKSTAVKMDPPDMEIKGEKGKSKKGGRE